MKKAIIFLSVALTISLFFNLLPIIKIFFAPSDCRASLRVAYFVDSIKKSGTIIDDEETALEYGKLILFKVYGEKTFSQNSFTVSYDSFHKVWRVQASWGGMTGEGWTVIFEKNGRILTITY